MSVPNATPDAVDLDEAFKAAMAGPAKPREPGPPPEIDEDAPHGRDPQSGTPLAPFGLNRDGRPRKGPGGRRAKDAPRIEKPGEVAPASTPGQKPGKPQPVVLDPKDYSKPLVEAADSVWVAMSSASKIPLIPGGIRTVIGAEARIFYANKDGLAGALNVAAQHNGRARSWAEKLAKGDVSWVLTCFGMVTPFLVQTGMMLRGGIEGFPSKAELADANDTELAAYVEAMMHAQAEKAPQLTPEPVAA